VSEETTPFPTLTLDEAPPWTWPMPPGGRRHAPPPPTGAPQACRIETPAGSPLLGDMVAFDPATRRLELRAGGSGPVVSLPFARIRRLTLTTPLPRLSRAAGAPRERVPSVAQERDYSLQQVGDAHASPLTGRTAGSVDTPEGMYLFTPIGDDGAVQRVFVPRGAYSRCEFGASAEELAARHWIASPAKLLAAMQEQQRAVVPLGQALIELGLLTAQQLQRALATLDGKTALGETLVNAGLLSRTDLQTALARKMGYALVDLERFPVDPAALALLPLRLAISHRMLPLLRHEGGLIVAVDRPARILKLRQLDGYAKLPIVPALALKAQILVALNRLSGEGWNVNPSERVTFFDTAV
jgi:hypothetical protein